MDGLNIDPNSSYLRWRLNHLQRPPGSHYVAANEPPRPPPSSPPANTARSISCSFFIFPTALGRTSLGTSLTLEDSVKRQLLPRSTTRPAWRLRELELWGGLGVLDDYITMLTRSLFVSSTWSSSPSTFTVILPYRCVALDGDKPGAVIKLV